MNAVIKPIPVTVVTGFLGSGKTTVLRKLVRRRQQRRLALLINEFGEVSIDGAMMQGVASEGRVEIHDFAHGLIAYGGDEQFMPTMAAIAARRAQVDHVLIETSGLALPTAVMELLQSPALAADFVLDATLAVVDTPLLLEKRFDAGDGADNADDAVADMFARQLAAADVVVLNKIDDLDEAALLAAEERVRRGAPNVRFLELAYRAELDIRLALGLRLHQAGSGAGHGHAYTPLPAADAQPLAMQSLLNGHAHSGMAAHSHGLATHKHFHEQDPGWLSFVLRCGVAQEVGALKAALLTVAHAEPLLRCKGFIRDGAGAAWLIQGVRARFTLDAADAKTATTSELVFIGYHLDRARVAALMSQMTGLAWK